jgi:hypothetical protein
MSSIACLHGPSCASTCLVPCCTTAHMLKYQQIADRCYGGSVEFMSRHADCCVCRDMLTAGSAYCCCHDHAQCCLLPLRAAVAQLLRASA